MARRIGTFGLGALIVGAVLVATSVGVSAAPASKASTVTPLKKTTTTTSTTTTSTTTPPASTTTQPCTPAPATGTGVNTTVTPNTTATLTANPGTCAVDGTVTSLTGSGFVPNALGTFLECNSDPGQPTVFAFGNQIPISCSGPLSTQGPGPEGVSAAGTFGPFNFTIKEGTIGPPCAPSSCNGGPAPTGASTDSAGGDPFVDAAKYPCPPTAAQAAAGQTCGILFGDTKGDGVTVNIAFNTAVAPPPATIGTAAPASAAGTGSTPAAAKAKTTKTAPASLAFTGSGPGLWWLALVGMVLIVFGLMALAALDEPRRVLRLAAARIRSRRSP